jgi:hypothetical protein
MPPYFKEAESWEDLAQASKSFPEDFLFDVQKATAAFPDNPPPTAGSDGKERAERRSCRASWM